MLLCTSMVMGLLPLSMHLCCEERCCDAAEVQASCCAASSTEKPVAPEDDCCSNQSFFNLAPVFAPIKIEVEKAKLVTLHLGHGEFAGNSAK